MDWLRWFAVLLSAAAAPALGQAVALAPGDLVVSGWPLAESAAGLYRVDPVSAGHALIAVGDFRDHGVGLDGLVFAIDGDAVVRVDPETGLVEPLALDLGAASPEGIAIARTGAVYLMTTTPGGPPYGTDIQVLAVDPVAGSAEEVSAGGFLAGVSRAMDLEVSVDGDPLVLASGVIPFSIGVGATVVRIDAATGAQTVVTPDDPLGFLQTAVGLGVGVDPALYYAIDGNARCNCVGVIDPATGSIGAATLAVEGDGGTAVLLGGDVAVGLDGQVFVLAYSVLPESLIDPGLYRFDGEPVPEAGGGPFLAAASGIEVQVAPGPDLCGDGLLTGLEECDDGNPVSADGCSASCLVEECGNQRVDALEECDDGNLESGDGCDANCTVTACGNDVATAGEECDDGDLESGDGCDANCTLTGCGNAVATAGEACDDGNAVDDDGCDRHCQVNFGAQTKAQRRCIAAVNRAVGRVAGARAEANERCLEDAARGRLPSGPDPFDACLAADPGGGVARAVRRLEARDRDACQPGRLPELALGADRVAGGPAAGELASALARDLFGDPAQPAPGTDRAAARCQQTALERADALFARTWLELRRAKKDKLAGRGSAAPAVNDEELAAHAVQAASASPGVARSAGAMRRRTAAACGGVADLAALLPGCGAAEPGGLADCVERAARCRACLLLLRADPRLPVDCGAFDDLVADESCPSGG